MGSDGARRCPVCGATAGDYYNAPEGYGWSCWVCGSSQPAAMVVDEITGYDDEPLDVTRFNTRIHYGYGRVEYVVDDDRPIEEINESRDLKIWTKRRFGETRAWQDRNKERILFEANVYQGKIVIVHWEQGYKPYSLFMMKLQKDESTGKLYLVSDMYDDYAFRPLNHKYYTKPDAEKDTWLVSEIKRQMPIYERLMHEIDYSKSGQPICYNKYDVAFTALAVWNCVLYALEHDFEKVTTENYRSILLEAMYDRRSYNKLGCNLQTAIHRATGFGEMNLKAFFEDLTETYKRAEECHAGWLAMKAKSDSRLNSLGEEKAKEQQILDDLKKNGPKIDLIQKGAPYLEVIDYTHSIVL